MVDEQEVLHADKKTVRKYGLIILGVFVVGTVIVSLWVQARVSVTEQDKSRARSNCVAWVGHYVNDDAKAGSGGAKVNAAAVCEEAEQTDARQFYRRWSGGGNSIPVPTNEPGAR